MTVGTHNVQSAPDFSTTFVIAERHVCSKVAAERNSVVIIINLLATDFFFQILANFSKFKM